MEAMKAAQPRVPVCLAAHSLEASNFPTLTKQVLLSAISQSKCISVLSVKRESIRKKKAGAESQCTCVCASVCVMCVHVCA